MRPFSNGSNLEPPWRWFHQSLMMLNPHDATQQSTTTTVGHRQAVTTAYQSDGINAAAVVGGVSSQITDSDRPSIYT